MSGAPFRDALAPLIADAERQLAGLREQRAMLEEHVAEVQRDLKKRAGLRRFMEGVLLGSLLCLGLFVLNNLLAPFFRGP